MQLASDLFVQMRCEVQIALLAQQAGISREQLQNLGHMKSGDSAMINAWFSEQ
jgi:hypothetical protein